MAFTLPPERSETAEKLLKLEPQAPKDIRAVMVQAAQELRAWKQLAESAAAVIDEAVNVRYSQMSTTAQVDEQQSRVKQSLSEVARRLLEMP